MKFWRNVFVFAHPPRGPSGRLERGGQSRLARGGRISINTRQQIADEIIVNINGKTESTSPSPAFAALRATNANPPRVRVMNFRFRKLVVLLFVVGCFLVSANNADASAPATPILNQIVPRGVQRGTTKEVNFHGERLFGAQEVFFYDEGFEVKKLEQVSDKVVKVTIAVSSDCRLGEHVAQLRTADGVSDYRNFYVGVLPEIDEVEPNSSFETPQEIEMGRTVNGVINSEDMDWFQIKATAGQRISVEIEAIRLGVMFDPWIEMRDADGKELIRCDDSPLTKQDGHFSILAPADGVYNIMVRETSWGGNDQSRYRLHVGDFPRPTVAYPAGGKFGETREILFLGDPSGPIKKSVVLPDSKSFRDGVFYRDDSGVCPSPLPFMLSHLDSFEEVEPNDKFPDQAALTLPCAIDGRLARGDTIDYHKFTAKKGETWIIDCRARCIGSPLDAMMNVYDASNKKHLAGNDDASGKPDPQLRFKAPADGDYYVRVLDHLRRSGDDFVYRLEIDKPKPTLSVGIKRNDRYSQRQQQIAIHRGNRFAALFDTRRADFNTAGIKLIADSLPEGVTMESRPLPSNMNFMPVVFSASKDAVIEGALCEILGQPLETDKEVTTSFSMRADFALGAPNNQLYFACDVDKAAVAVLKSVPFRLEMVPPATPLLRDGSTTVKVKIHRDEGFEKDVLIYFPFRPPGVSAKYQVKIAKNVSEFDYPLSANNKSAVGKWPVYVNGRSEMKGAAWVSTKLQEIEIAEPRVKIQTTLASITQGETADLSCTVEQLIPFEGEATAELIGLPPHVTSDSPLKFDSSTETLTFKIETTEKSPLGKHSPQVRVKIPHQGGMMTATAGRGQIRINKARTKVATK